VTRSTQLRNSMSEVVSTTTVLVKGRLTRRLVKLSCGHELTIRDKEMRPERRCPVCPKKGGRS